MLSEYLAHFGLKESPFARNLNPKWLYLSTQHKEMILKTRWVVESHSGLALWRADVGYGKSSLIEYLMTVWPRQFGWNCAKLQNTGTINGERTLLAEVMAAFGLEAAGTTRKMATQLETWLLSQAFEENKNVVLFIDEAQSIASRAFPVIRDLINLQTRDRILLQVVMAGQLNLEQKLRNFPALRSRITTATTFRPLTFDEADAMLLHRFELAGAYDPFRICSSRAVQVLYDHSQGVPRDFVIIAEGAMKEAFLRDAPRVEAEHVEHAVRSLEGRQDYVPIFSSEDIPTLSPLKTINRAAVASLQEMNRVARAA